MKNVAKESNCEVTVDFDDNRHESAIRIPMKILVTPRSRSSAAKDMNCARELIQDLLLDYVKLDGERGRLLYEVASSCPGPHRPQASASMAIGARDPYTPGGPYVFMTLMRLPYEVIKGKKQFHVDFLLNSSLLTLLWKETDCYVKACANNRSCFPVKHCFPYLLIMGPAWRAVDRAAEIVHNDIKKYIFQCSGSIRY